MRYCLHSPSNKYINKADEITISVASFKDINLKKIIDLFLNYKEKQINIYIEHSKDFLESHGVQTIQAIKTKYPELNIKFALSNYSDTEDDYELWEAIKQTKIPFFFTNVVNNWQVLHGLLEMGASEMYISESLAFELDKVAAILHERGVKVRCFPNIAQAAWKFDNNIKAFYIRPEDISAYEKYVDTIEFYCFNQEEEALYKIYALDKTWPGYLHSLIKELDGLMQGKFTPPNFAEKRTRCGQKCLKGGLCNLCGRGEELSIVLDKANQDLQTPIDNL